MSASQQLVIVAALALVLPFHSWSVAHAREVDALADLDARIETADPDDPVGLAELLLERGKEYRFAQRADAALADYEQARRLFAKSLGPNDDRVAVTWLERGRVMLDTGRNEEGRNDFLRARAIYAGNHGLASELYIRTSLSVSAADWRIRGPAASLPTLVEARELLTEFDASTSLRVSISQRLATTHAALGHFTQAEEFFREGFALTEEDWDPDDPERAELALGYGLHLLWNGVFSEAPPWLTKALEEFERIQGPRGLRTLATLRNLAEAHRLQGKVELARREYQEAIDRADGDANPRAAAHAWNGLGLVALDLGDTGAARRAFERADEYCRRGAGPESELTAQTKGNLADVFAVRGDYARAIELYEEVGRIYSTALGPDASDVQFAAITVGRLRREQGDYLGSAEQLDQLIDRLERATAPDDSYLAQAYTELARTRFEQKRWRESSAAATRATELAAKAYGPGSPHEGAALAQRAWAERASGDLDAARRDALRTESIGQKHLGDRIRWLPERTALAWAQRRPTGLGVLIDVALESGRSADARQVFDTVASTRGRVFDELGRRARLARRAQSPELSRLFREVRVARERLADFALNGPAPPTVVQEAMRKKDEAERALAAESAPDFVERSADAASIRERIPEDTALLSFVRTKDLRGHPHRYVALLHAADLETPRIFDLGDARSIDDAVRDFVVALNASISATGPLAAGALRPVRQSGKTLRRLVLDSMKDALAGYSRLLLVPDGSLFAVQWYALPEGESGWWIESGPIVHLLTSERDLLLEGDRESGEGLLCFGNPDFDRAETGFAVAAATRGRLVGCRDLDSLSFGALASAKAEIEFVAATWEQAGSSQARTIRGDAATEPAFARAAHGPKLLHLATHGFYLGGDCPDASATAEFDALLENPLLLSGLVLSGANRRDSPTGATDDGILSAEEIACLDLSPARLAVLSACETGSGQVTPGEGILGLRWAFRLAGVDALVSSLWSIDDIETTAWMRAFYTALLVDRKALDESIRDASLNRLHHRREKGLSQSPAFWAAFVGSGDWR